MLLRSDTDVATARTLTWMRAIVTLTLAMTLWDKLLIKTWSHLRQVAHGLIAGT